VKKGLCFVNSPIKMGCTQDCRDNVNKRKGGALLTTHRGASD